jgi:hypothetical protein
MAYTTKTTKNWKRAKSGESKLYPVVFRRKDDKDNTLVIKKPSFSKFYFVEHDGYLLKTPKTKSKSQAVKYAKSYMKQN